VTVNAFTFPGVVSAPTFATKLLTCAAVVRSGAHAACWSELIQPWKYASKGVEMTHASVRRDVRSPEPGRIVALVCQVPSKSFALHCCSDAVPPQDIPQLPVARATMSPACGVWVARAAVTGRTLVASSRIRTRRGRLARIRSAQYDTRARTRHRDVALAQHGLQY
jgi:hypothetical protein